jgi:DGQHR domain-containing protein
MKNNSGVVRVVESSPLHSGIRVFVGVVLVRDLLGSAIVPLRDSMRETGYQRRPSKARVRKLATRILEGSTDIELPLILSIRESRRVTRNQEGVDVSLDFRGPVYVVDGQHRLEALKKIVESGAQHWLDKQIPFSCFLGATELQEAQLFLSINANAKPVRLDLARELVLAYGPQRDPILTEGQRLARQVAVSNYLWAGKIGFEGGNYPDKLIGNGAFGDSLKIWLTLQAGRPQVLGGNEAILNAFWFGIRDILPECFLEPKNFGLQKQTGVRVLHALLAEISGPIAANGLEATNPEIYSKILGNPLKTLSGVLADGVTSATGFRFWRVGVNGLAGSFSSAAGQRRLTEMISRQIDRSTAYLP